MKEEKKDGKTGKGKERNAGRKEGRNVFLEGRKRRKEMPEGRVEEREVT